MPFRLGFTEETVKAVRGVCIEAMSHVEVICGGVGVSKEHSVFGNCGLGYGIGAVLQRDIQFSAVFMRKQDKAQNTGPAYVKTDVFYGCEINARKGIVNAVLILDSNLIDRIGGDSRYKPHARNTMGFLVGDEMEHLIHFVGVGVEGAIQQNGRSLGIQLHSLDVLDLHLFAWISDIETQGGNDVGIVGDCVEDNGVGVPFSVRNHIKADALLGGMSGFLACNEEQISFGGGGFDRKLYGIVLGCREAKPFLRLVLSRIGVGIVSVCRVADDTVLDGETGCLIELYGALGDDKGHFLGYGGSAHKVLPHDVRIVVVITHAVDIGIGGGGGLGCQVGFSVLHGDENVHRIFKVRRAGFVA